MSAATSRENLLLLPALVVVSMLAPGCNDTDPTEPPRNDPPALAVLGRGDVSDRYTAELWVRGNTAYTTTWGNRFVGGKDNRGNAIKIWNVAGNDPVLVDSIIVENATTLGDVQVSDDGRLLVVATEFVPGSIIIYDLADPQRPRLLSRFSSPNTNSGVHTAEIQRVNGTVYAFLSVDPGPGGPARLVIVDLSNPAMPAEIFSRQMGRPYVHDVFVRDGVLMTALWDDGIGIFDIGGLGRGGTVANPVLVSTTATAGGNAHNIWWFHDPVTGSKRYAFVGEEGPAAIGYSSTGDIHVVDVSDMANPSEVAFFTVPSARTIGGYASAGTHNFSMDEQAGILYAAYYNGGVRVIDVRGDLGSCLASQRSADNRCDLSRMDREIAAGLLNESLPVYIWGVQYTESAVYASDMLNGLWKLAPAKR
jgi:hypothetical protein